MKILVLTTIYKDIEDPKDAATTPVVQNFAKEWVKLGNEVLLIHNMNVFPKVFYMVPQLVWDKLSARRGFRTILNIQQTMDISYVNDGVKVYRSTIKKPIPLGAYSKKALEHSVEKIKSILEENSFTPDVIISHMENPQIYQMVKLKEVYPKAITSLVFHGIDYLNQPKYKAWKDEYLPEIDKIGFRSKQAYRQACRLIGFNREHYFLCPSGISNEFVETVPDFDRKFKNGKLRILYVGQFIPRKHVETLIRAVKRILDTKSIEVSVSLIGSGIDEQNLRQLVQSMRLERVITFKGRQPHTAVLEEMKNSDVFVMVSENEVFGLVYTEAMSQGCVVIASTEGGMEGIVNDGMNGYMSQAGDVDALVGKLLTIVEQDREENIRLARMSYETAQKYTECAVAEEYLNHVMYD